MLELANYHINAWTTVEAGSWTLCVELRSAGDTTGQKITYNLGPARSGPIPGAVRMENSDLLRMDRAKAALLCGKIVEALLSTKVFDHS